MKRLATILSVCLLALALAMALEKVKKKKPTNNERKRKKYVEESRLADEVVLGNLKNKYAVIENYKPDVICLGYDQTFFIDELKNKLAEFGLKKTKIIRLKPHKAKIYKSSLLRKKRQ